MKCPICKYEWITKSRTLQQNKSYWGLIIVPLAEYLGLTNDECHDLMKYKFNKEVVYTEIRDGTWEEVTKIKSTANMTTVEHSEYCSKIRVWASHIGCWLAEPGEENV